ncbi:MAG: SapC family protein, partial [Gammaproteobacteria bacterium]|nr:SapC family protein [Gammaproteobacteria bacterium]
MPDFAMLNNVDHQDLRVITERSSRYGDNVMLAMTFPFEFRNVQAHYPILFQGDGDGGYYPVVLFGFQQGENLFLDESGWHAAYVPAMIQRQPFLIGFQEQPGADRTRVLSVDMDHPRVNTEAGERLFQPLGGR